MHLYLGAPPPVLSGAQYLAAAQAAAAAWSHEALNCSDVRLTIVEEGAVDANPGADRKNMIVFRQSNWAHSPNALAVTTIWKNKKTGEIADTDIEVNAADAISGTGYLWNDLTAGSGRGLDFQNMLTHELGHVLGLAHNCFTPTDTEPSTTDHQGNPTVHCYAGETLTEAITQATMYPSVERSDISRRDLTEDDKQGICAVYPYTHSACPVAEDSGGCQVAPQPTRPSGLWLAFLGILGLALALRLTAKIWPR